MIKRKAPAAARLMAAVLAAGLLAAGCGKKTADPDAVHYALVTDSAGITNGAVSELSAGMELAAQAGAFRTQIYPAAADSEEALKDAFDAAATDKAAYVLCQGKGMEKALGSAQAAHKNTRYIIFDGVPISASGKTEEIRSNTMCVSFDKASMGFLVGYAVVKEGIRQVGYMTSSPDSADSIAYQTGFLNGAGYAQQVLGLDAGSVTILREYAMTDKLSPMRMMDAGRLYDSGAEIIVTDTENFLPAIKRAAADRGGRMGSIGFNPGDGSVVIASGENREGAAEWLLKSLEADSKAFPGGDILNAGAMQNGVKLSVDYSSLTAFTETDMQHVTEAMSGGNAEITGTPDENGTPGLTSAGSMVTVQEFAPVTPDPEAGLHTETPVQQAASEAETGEAE